jgi:hypothetical protein
MRLACALSLVTFVACGDPDPSTSPDAAPQPDGGVEGERVGQLRLLEDHWINPEDGSAFDHGDLLGFYLDAAPIAWHHEEARVGDCALMRYTPANCDPPCGNDVCVATNTCRPLPSFHSAGRLTVTGLTAALTVDGPTGYYTPPVQLPIDLFADDATITAALAGAAVPAHTITARGVLPLVATIGTKRTLVPGQPHTITWTPAGGDARVQLEINANNRGHGAPYMAIIRCDVPDSAGAVTIAAALVDAFPENRASSVCAGSDCPPSTLRRYRRGTTAAPGGVAELIVGSQISFGVDHVP